MPQVIVQAKIEEMYTYTLFDGRFVTWNITRAIDLIKARPIINGEPRPKLFMTPEDIQNWFSQSGEGLPTNEASGNVDQVDPDQPGIIAPIWIEETNQVHHVLIDGNTRALRCLREKRNFEVFPLSVNENLFCFVDGSLELLPTIQQYDEWEERSDASTKAN